MPRTARRNALWAGRIVCIIPSLSGTPSTRLERSATKSYSKDAISLYGSLEGSLGSLPKATFVLEIDFSSSSWISGTLRRSVPVSYGSTYTSRNTYRFDIKSERIELKRDTKLAVPRYFLYMSSSSHHGVVKEKNWSSLRRASVQFMPCFNSFEPGCLTQYQLFSSGSFSFRIKPSQLGSSPVGIRSGFVKTPVQETNNKWESYVLYKEGIPMVRFPSGSWTFASS